MLSVIVDHVCYLVPADLQIVIVIFKVQDVFFQLHHDVGLSAEEFTQDFVIDAAHVGVAYQF